MIHADHGPGCSTMLVADEIERCGAALLVGSRRRDLQRLGLLYDCLQDSWLQVVGQQTCIRLDDRDGAAWRLATWRCNHVAGRMLTRNRAREARELSFDAYRAGRSTEAVAALAPRTEVVRHQEVTGAEEEALAAIELSADAARAPWVGAEDRISTRGMRMTATRRAVVEEAALLVVRDLQRDPRLRVAWKRGLAFATLRVRSALVAVDADTFAPTDPDDPRGIGPAARQDLYGAHPARMNRVVFRVVDRARRP